MADRPLPVSERLRFREMNGGDLFNLHDMFSDTAARRFYPQMRHFENVQAWIDWNLQNYARYGFGLWVLTCAETGAFVGDCGLTYQVVEDRDELEIGYHVALPHRHRGLALEAGRAVLRYGLEHCDAAMICSKVAPHNAASIGVASRLHRLRREYRNDRGERRLLFYTLRS